MKNKKIKRLIIFGIVFSIVSFLVLSLFTSAFDGGIGTLDDPYQIGTCLHLQNMSNGLDLDYILMNDINCTNTSTWNGGDGFDPIGDSTTAFSGTFDGNNYSIINLFINRTDENEVGLFGYLINTAEITNIRLKSVNISGNRSVGALLGGDLNGGVISFSYSTGNVSGYRIVGGLVGGEGSGGTGTTLISNSHSNATVVGTGNNYHGGLVGVLAGGTIINSYSTGNVSGNLVVGGLAGSWGGDINNSYSTGYVSGAGVTGGLVADGLAWTSNVTDSFWDMNISGQTTSTGGTGKNTTDMKNVTIFTDISKSGLNTSWDFINSPNNDSLGHDYWMINSSINNGYPRLRGPQTFQGGNGSASDPYQIATCWELQEISETFSHLRDNYVLNSDINCSNTTDWNSGAGFIPIKGRGIAQFSGTLNGDGHTINGLIINDAASTYVGMFYSIKSSLANITNVNLVGNITGANYVGGFIGLITGGVSGSKVITNSSMEGNISGTGIIGGIVGENNGGIIDGSYFNGTITSSGNRVGGLIGHNEYGGIAINNSYANATISGVDYVGGLIGSNFGGDIVDSYFEGTVTSSGNRVGGLVGNNQYYNGEIPYVNTSYANATISGVDYVGGLTGINFGGSIVESYFVGSATSTGYYAGGITGANQYIGTNPLIEESYSIGTMIGVYYVGGLVGNHIDGIINNSYARGNATGTYNVGGLTGSSSGTISNSYATGSISGSVNPGGLIGQNLSSTITNSFWDKETSGTSISQGGTGKTTAEMKTEATFTDTSTDGLDTAWDFTEVWRINTNANDGYPYLTYFFIELVSPSTSSGIFSQDYIESSAKSRMANSDTITIYLRNSTSPIQSNTTTDDSLSVNFTSLPEETYYLNATVNDTSGNIFSTGIRTIILDTTDPNVIITTTNGTTRANSYLILIEYNISDINIDTCYFSLRNSSGDLHNYAENTSVVCTTTSITISTLDYGTYTFQLWGEDSVGNLDYGNVTWTSELVLGGGPGGGGPETIVEVFIYENRTYCGDLICQNTETGFPTGNDYNIQENYWNCQQDCSGAVGENLDELVFSLTSYCFDNDPSTVCFWVDQLFSTIPGTNITDGINQTTIQDGQICFDGTCERISGKTLFTNCLDGDSSSPCFFDANLGLLVLFGTGAGLLVISFIKVKSPVGKERVNPYSYVVLRARKGGRMGRR